MSYRQFIVILFMVFLFSCGGKDDDGNTPPIANTNNGLAPVNISQAIFDMSIDVLPVEKLGNNFPIIGNKIIQEYGANTIFYLQSDQYGGWKYQGEFEYQRNEDEAKVSLTLASSNTVYSINYQFIDHNSGTWQGRFNNGLSELSGTFTTKNTPNFNKHAFLGIVVGITQGPVGRREVDFRWPGSSDYLNFLALEMLPLVESQYRIDSSNRTLYGHSYGGLLVRHALANEVHAPLFQNFIASDGSYWFKSSVYLELETDVYNANSLLNKKLYLVGASQANGPFVNTFNNTIRSYGLLDFTIYYQSFDLSHSQVVLPGIRNSLETLFP